MGFHVLVDDFCWTDHRHRYIKGEYETYGEALAVCREIVDRFLRHECAPGVPASALYFRYMMFGKDPCIVGYPESPDTSPGFSAWDYARARCEELCSGNPEKERPAQRRHNVPGSAGGVKAQAYTTRATSAVAPQR